MTVAEVFSPNIWVLFLAILNNSYLLAKSVQLCKGIPCMLKFSSLFCFSQSNCHLSQDKFGFYSFVFAPLKKEVQMFGSQHWGTWSRTHLVQNHFIIILLFSSSSFLFLVFLSSSSPPTPSLLLFSPPLLLFLFPLFLFLLLQLPLLTWFICQECFLSKAQVSGHISKNEVFGSVEHLRIFIVLVILIGKNHHFILNTCKNM